MTIIAAGATNYHFLSISGGRLKECGFHYRLLRSSPDGRRNSTSLASSSTVSNFRSRRIGRPPRRLRREIPDTVCALNTGDITPEADRGTSFQLGATRLQRIIQSGSDSLVSRFQRSRKHFPAKIFLLLLGYYSANALATVLGQTGDWDVLAAGVLVALIEGIGYLMYKMPPFLGGRGKEVVTLLNFYKSGFSFGLFVDAFKLGS